MGKKTHKPLWWQDQPCPPWCSNPHKDDTGVADRSCFSEWEGKVNLTYAEDGGDYELRRDDKKVFWPPNLNVHVRQEYREVFPRVVLGFDQTGTTFDLTPGEARALAGQLTRAPTWPRVTGPATVQPRPPPFELTEQSVIHITITPDRLFSVARWSHICPPPVELHASLKAASPVRAVASSHTAMPPLALAGQDVGQLEMPIRTGEPFNPA